MNDVWTAQHAGHPNWGPACGEREPDKNQRVRESYDVPLDSVQLLPTVNTGDDTVRIYLGEIRDPKAAAPDGDADDDD
jgi:hypothetical protein